MSQTVNLDTKYSKKIDQAFTIASLLKGRLSAENEFVGARTVRIHNINTVPLNDYNRGASANRYGEPAEVGDTVQELTMTQDKSFSGVIDKGNNMDQSINKAGKFLGVEMSEEVIPAYDKYCFGRLCTLAGKIVGSADAVSGTNVIKRMSAARKWMLDRSVLPKKRSAPTGQRLGRRRQTSRRANICGELNRPKPRWEVQYDGNAEQNQAGCGGHCRSYYGCIWMDGLAGDRLCSLHAAGLDYRERGRQQKGRLVQRHGPRRAMA